MELHIPTRTANIPSQNQKNGHKFATNDTIDMKRSVSESAQRVTSIGRTANQ